MKTATETRPTSKRLWTYDEMVAELAVTNQPVELWNGEIVMLPAPHPDHQEIVLNFASTLKAFVQSQKLGRVYVSPIDVVLTRHRVVQPDVVFISSKRQDIIQSHIAGVPDLAMEVISEGSWERDRIQKKALYEQFGLPEYWIMDPDSRTIEVFVLEKGAYELHGKGTDAETVRSRLLPGFGLAFAELRDRSAAG